MGIKSKHIRVLKEITDSIPTEWIGALMKKEKQFSSLKQVLEHALTQPDSDFSPDKKKRARDLLDSGYLEREIDVVDTTVEDQIGQYLEGKIAEAVKLGRLPKKAPKLKLLNNKGKQYARRNANRIKELVGNEGNAEGEISKDDPAVEG